MIWSGAIYMGGDIGTLYYLRYYVVDKLFSSDYTSAQKAKRNVLHSKTNVEIFHWTARKLPFKQNSVDKVISDLPFGRRSGTFHFTRKSKIENREPKIEK